jgi:hypothetical protein
VQRRWWILAFAISFLALFSTLLFLTEDAYAKSVGQSLEGAVGGGGDHDGGRKGGDGGGGHTGGGARSHVNEAADAVGSGAQRGGQALKDAFGGVDRSVGKEAKPVSDVAGPVASKKIGELSQITEPVVDKSAEITRPLVNETGPLVVTVNNVAEPVVTSAGQAVEPVGAAASLLVEPIAETTRPVVEPVGEIAGPLVSPVGETATTPLAALVGTEIGMPAVEPRLFEPVVGPSLGQHVDAIEPAAVMPMDEASDIALLPLGELFGTVSSEGAVLHSEFTSAAQAGIEGSSDASADGLAITEEEASSAKAAQIAALSKVLSTNILAALQGAVSSVEDVLPIQIPQPLDAAGAAVAAGSLSGGSSSDSGTGLGILALVLVSLLGGKSLWSARESLKPSTTLIPIIERPG